MKPLLLTLFFLPTVAFATSSFTITLEGQGRFVLTNPSGERIGSEGTAIYEEIASSTIQLNSRGQGVSVLDARAGVYQLDMTGHGYDRDAILEIQYLDNSDTYQSYRYDIITHVDHSNTWHVDISSATVTSPYFNPPALDHTDYNNTVQLTWDSPFENISHYTIYRKAWDFPFYEQLATTNQTVHQTSNVWGTVLDENSTIPTDWYSYRVTWTDNQGNESVLSNTVSNSDRDNDNISDYRETNIYQTNPQNSDSDGDLLNDFLEINLYRTDPNDSDTDGDTYNDGIEIEQQTDPLNSNSFPGTVPLVDDGRDTTPDVLDDGRDPGATPGDPVIPDEPVTDDDLDYDEVDDLTAPFIPPTDDDDPTYTNGRNPNTTPTEPTLPIDPPLVDESPSDDSDDPTDPPVDPEDDPSEPAINNGRDPNDVPGEGDTPEEPETPDESGDDDQDTVDPDWNGR